MKSAIYLYRDNSPENGGAFHSIDPTVTSIDSLKYEVQERIAAGGNGVVHECTAVATGTMLALKFQTDLRGDRRKRFTRECELGQQATHDHLLRILGRGEVAADLYVPDSNRGNATQRFLREERIPFIVMERARCTLYQALKRGRTWRPEEYIAQFRGLAAALGNLHKFGLHRDIKPQNILLIGERWVLGDYGLCSLHAARPEDQFTPDWEVIGPKYWMSPEANNRAVGTADEICKQSDVFQLASVFWYVVTHRHPTGIVKASDWTGPVSVLPVILRALHHDRSVRPADGSEFASAITEAVVA